MRLRGLLLALAMLAGGPAGDAGAASVTTTSANWAGYAARRTGLTFHRVSGSWTVPVVDCSIGAETLSAHWVGLGGYSDTSPALDQIGTEADCDPAGQPAYSAWYELVPSAARTIHLTVRPGDRMLASVVVTGHRVRVRLVDSTRRTSFTRTIAAATVDTTSAEWIVEAPSLCAGADASSCQIMPLADFGTTAIGNASATSDTGHRGGIADPGWTTTAIDLTGGSGAFDGPDGRGGPPGRGRFGSGAGATTGAVNAAGTAFSVTYTA